FAIPVNKIRYEPSELKTSEDVQVDPAGKKAFKGRNFDTVFSVEEQPGDERITTVRVGTRLGRYEIISQLGSGGMGEIYLANDTQLDRRVALKLLSDKYTGNPLWLRRFIREAKAASALNHPNIITIHEIGKAGGVHFIATEYIEGKTLRQHLVEGPMKIT